MWPFPVRPFPVRFPAKWSGFGLLSVVSAVHVDKWPECELDGADYKKNKICSE